MIKMYTKENCPSCVKAKKLFNKHNIVYDLYTIGVDISREEFIAKFPNVKTVPYIIDNNKPIGGYESAKKYYNIS